MRAWMVMVLLAATVLLQGCGYNTLQTQDEQITHWPYEVVGTAV